MYDKPIVRSLALKNAAKQTALSTEARIDSKLKNKILGWKQMAADKASASSAFLTGNFARPFLRGKDRFSQMARQAPTTPVTTTFRKNANMVKGQIFGKKTVSE